ncbi:competence protein CoiA family protein [Amycolatopsis carbonis]|uniref:Competence protein CoiA family protein n=1 Tax=Amycolatopsis carbonis TaxID=715471 RepID=A0A9Y2IE79_9PSEU|nr:competence protein CoiA family protein [Amycolatopsis sp. 2-15]WIX78755.1 competence protein CoiA family protein [Amycolatopsis sp. 2-15]
MVVKPGRIKVSHFAHVARSDCPSARESVEHLQAKKVLAASFRALGYEVALEAPHSGDRRVDIAVTVPYPLLPLRYAVEVQNSPIDPREMFRRLLSDLKVGYWFTGWVFTGRRAATLLAADVGDHVRLPADVLAEEGFLKFPKERTSRRQLSEVIGDDPSNWISERIGAGSYGCVGRLHGVKVLDTDGSLWHVQVDKVYPSRGGTSRSGAALQSVRRVSRKQKIPFDLFGPAPTRGDEQRLTLATYFAETLNDVHTAVDFDELCASAARALTISRTTEFDRWVRQTLSNIGVISRDSTVFEDSLRLTCQVFARRHGTPTDMPPCGWPPAPSPQLNR